MHDFKVEKDMFKITFHYVIISFVMHILLNFVSWFIIMRWWFMISPVHEIHLPPYKHAVSSLQGSKIIFAGKYSVGYFVRALGCKSE